MAAGNGEKHVVQTSARLSILKHQKRAGLSRDPK